MTSFFIFCYIRTMLERVGKLVLPKIDGLLEVAALFVESIKVAFTEKGKGSKVVRDVVLRQILFTGIEALPVIIIIALLIGAAVIIEAFTQLPRVGGGSIIGNLLVVVVVRELGPIITAIIVIGRSGTAISTEIGYMMVNHEVQAIEMMGINPIRFIVLPRIVGVATAIFCLSFFFNIVALVGGYFSARFIVQYPLLKYIGDLSRGLEFWDVMVSGLKCLFFGIIVAVVCSYKGFSVRYSYTEIPQMTTKAVVMSIYLCFIVNIIITAFFYM